MKVKSRSEKAVLNGIAGLTYEFATIVCGLILPRLILEAFGSSYNGITQSITQFLSFVVLFRAGVGAVTKAALYKPLASGDIDKISKIVRATDIFMKRVSLIFLGGLIVLAVVYPLLVNNEFEWIFAATLVLIIGISTFVQYYFGITYQMLLEADQSQYIVSIVSMTTTITNILIATSLIKMGLGIHMVKLGSAVIFAANPIIINIIVHKKYKLKKDVEPDNSALSQRWDAFAQQVAMLVRDNTDIIILTIVSNTLEVSVYTVYFMVIKAINSMLRAFTNGVGAAFGNMLAKGENEAMKTNLGIYELLVYSLTTIFYSCVCVLITPFVLIYTNGINDVNYNRPVFGYILAFAYVFFCIRIPYQNIVEVAGHFKQTKKGAYVESTLNLSVSIILGYFYGIVGVAIGTLVAMAFRTFQYAFYVDKNLVTRGISKLFMHIVICLLSMATIIFINRLLPLFDATNYFLWLINAVITFILAFVVTFIFDLIFYKNELKILKQKAVVLIIKKKKIK